MKSNMFNGKTFILIIGVHSILGTTEAVYDTFEGRGNANSGKYYIDDLPETRFEEANYLLECEFTSGGKFVSYTKFY